jgi:hypothetical protein
MKSKILLFVLVCSIALFFVSCSDKVQTEQNENDNSVVDNIKYVNLPENLPNAFILSPTYDVWYSQLVLQSNGSFAGDSYKGDANDYNNSLYPDGTAYVSNFTGKFENITKINDYTYSMVIKDNLELAQKENETWFADGLKFISGDPIGITKDTDYVLYTSETPLKELSNEILSWWPEITLPEEERPEKLSCYCLYNVKEKVAFFAY